MSAALPPRLSAMLYSQLPWLLSMVLVVVLGVWLARLTWQWVAPPSPPPVAGAGVTVSAPAPASPLDVAAQLGRLSLFGEAAEPEPTQTIAASTLALDLRGVLSVGSDYQGVAILRIGGREQVFRVGDEIQSGIRLQRVEAGRVIIERAGRLESIDLPTVTLAELVSTPAANVSRATPAARQAPRGEAVSPVVREVVTNPENLFDYVQPRPVMQGGRLQGYRLQPLPGQQRLLAELGLQPGDVVVQIAGARMDNPETLMALMPRLAGATALSAIVLRDGREVPITIQLQ